MSDQISEIGRRTIRPNHARELARVQRRLDHREDQLRKSRRFTALVGTLTFIAGMVFQVIISAPPTWFYDVPTASTAGTYTEGNY